MRKRHEEPMYTVWEPLNETMDDGGRTLAAFSVEAAAKNHADFTWSHREGSARSWPMTFHVYDSSTKKTHAVDVFMELHPHFSAAKPVLLR